MNNRKINLRIVILVFVALSFISLVFLIGNKTNKSTNKTTKAEAGSNSGTVYSGINITNTSQLNNHLLASQFIAAKDAIAIYIAENISSDVRTATIDDNSIKMNGDGSFTFSFTTDNPRKTVVCGIATPDTGKLIFTVPLTNYSKTYYPYGSSTNFAQ